MLYTIYSNYLNEYIMCLFRTMKPRRKFPIVKVPHLHTFAMILITWIIGFVYKIGIVDIYQLR